MALSGYMTVEGSRVGVIEGSVTQIGREGTIEVFGWEHELVSPRDAATGLPTGKRQHRPLTIIKPVDKATPLLMEAGAQEDVLTVVLSTYAPTETGDEALYLEVELTNARIVKQRIDQLNNRYQENLPQPMTERVSLVYEEITVTFAPDGTSHRDSWESRA